MAGVFWEAEIGSDDTLGTVYFDRLFPMGVALKVRYDEGKKLSAAQFCAELGVTTHTQLGE